MKTVLRKATHISRRQVQVPLKYLHPDRSKPMNMSRLSIGYEYDNLKKAIKVHVILVMMTV